MNPCRQLTRWESVWSLSIIIGCCQSMMLDSIEYSLYGIKIAYLNLFLNYNFVIWRYFIPRKWCVFVYGSYTFMIKTWYQWFNLLAYYNISKQLFIHKCWGFMICCLQVSLNDVINGHFFVHKKSFNFIYLYKIS